MLKAIEDGLSKREAPVPLKGSFESQVIQIGTTLEDLPTAQGIPTSLAIAL